MGKREVNTLISLPCMKKSKKKSIIWTKFSDIVTQESTSNFSFFVKFSSLLHANHSRPKKIANVYLILKSPNFLSVYILPRGPNMLIHKRIVTNGLMCGYITMYIMSFRKSQKPIIARTTPSKTLVFSNSSSFFPLILISVLSMNEKKQTYL